MPQRTFKPDAAMIEKLRVKKGWALPDLATNALVSNRTIDSIMLGREVIISTLAKVAKAFEVPVESLVVGYVPEAPPKPKRFVISFKMAFDYQEFDESKDLMAFFMALQKLIGPDALGDGAVFMGSVIVTVEMNEKAIGPIVKAFLSKRFDEFKVTVIEFPPHMAYLIRRLCRRPRIREFFPGASCDESHPSDIDALAAQLRDVDSWIRGEFRSPKLVITPDKTTLTTEEIPPWLRG